MPTIWKVISIVSLLAIIALAVAVILLYKGGQTAQPAPATPSVPAVTAGTAETGISVSGQGEAKAKPDVAYVSVGVRTTAVTARQAMDQNSSTMAAIIAKLGTLGVQKTDMKTGNISLSPQTQSPKAGETGTDKIVGYWASNTLSVTINDITKTGEILDAAITAGANSVGGIRFGVKDDSKLSELALQDAVKNARNTADVALAGLGLKVKGVRSVSVDSYSAPRAVYAEALSASAKIAGVDVPIEGGEITVTASVRVTFDFQ